MFFKNQKYPEPIKIDSIEELVKYFKELNEVHKENMRIIDLNHIIQIGLIVFIGLGFIGLEFILAWFR